jgi:hypothetical protein
MIVMESLYESVAQSAFLIYLPHVPVAAQAFFIPLHHCLCQEVFGPQGILLFYQCNLFVILTHHFLATFELSIMV